MKELINLAHKLCIEITLEKGGFQTRTHCYKRRTGKTQRQLTRCDKRKTSRLGC